MRRVSGLLLLIVNGASAMGNICPPVSILKHGVVHTFVEDGDGGSANFVKDYFRDWEPETFQVFDELRDNLKVAIDLGAWIGTTSIWLSHRFRSVVAVEADPLACVALARNLEASACRNVVVIPRPVAKERANVVFGSNSKGGHLNDSTSQIKLVASSIDDVVLETVTLGDVTSVFDPDDVRLIKVDIEGGEESIIEDLVQFATQHPCCRLYISFHISWWKNQNLHRIETLFAAARVAHPVCGHLIAPVAFLREYPFVSLLFSFNE